MIMKDGAGAILMAARRKTSGPSNPDSGGFGRYAPETEKILREPDVVVSPGLATIRKCWERFKRLGENGDYRTAGAIVSSRDYSVNDVAGFSIEMSSTAGFPYNPHNDPTTEMYGNFLSALVNEGKEDSYSIVNLLGDIPTREWAYNIGFRNRKNLFIRGDVSNGFGREMG